MNKIHKFFGGVFGFVLFITGISTAIYIICNNITGAELYILGLIVIYCMNEWKKT